jgi:hypothetical protein
VESRPIASVSWPFGQYLRRGAAIRGRRLAGEALKPTPPHFLANSSDCNRTVGRFRDPPPRGVERARQAPLPSPRFPLLLESTLNLLSLALDSLLELRVPAAEPRALTRSRPLHLSLLLTVTSINA